MRWRTLLVSAALAVPVLAVPVTPAQAQTPVPSANIAVSYPSVCQSAPAGVACVQAATAALNHARSVLHQPAYVLPASFAALSSADQLLVLSNADRAVYGLPAITGRNATLTAAAQAGIAGDTDPLGPSVVSGVAYRGWTSNWAAGWGSPLFSYYSWMYDDGLGSGNIACTHAGEAGCWGHRLNVLHDFGAGTQVAMGVGAGTSPHYRVPAFTTLYEAFGRGAALPYVPTVTGVSLSPAGVVVLVGSGFVGVQSVRAGTRAVPFTIIAPTLLALVLPLGTGPVSIVVTTTGGTSTPTAFGSRTPPTSPPRRSVVLVPLHLVGHLAALLAAYGRRAA